MTPARRFALRAIVNQELRRQQMREITVDEQRMVFHLESMGFGALHIADALRTARADKACGTAEKQATAPDQGKA